jgi:hypothetical protein
MTEDLSYSKKKRGEKERGGWLNVFAFTYYPEGIV